MNKEFNLTICLEDTNELFSVKNVTVSTKIIELKQQLELISGIPKHMQCLMYLDRGQMEDNSILQHHDVVGGAQLTMTVWQTWKALLKACVNGSLNEILALGVTSDSKYSDARTKYMNEEAKKNFYISRGNAALYITAHRGHHHVIKKLIKEGADFEATTDYGRTPLHVAAFQGQDKCIELLLANGSGTVIHSADTFGKSPLQLASQRNHKSSERRLFLYQWQERAAKVKLSSSTSNTVVRAHQMFDSSLVTWLQGSQSQLYLTHITPPEEFQGGGLDSKKSEYKKILKSSGTNSSNATRK